MEHIHVLVVDDESLARARMRDLLQSLGIDHIIEAESSAMAFTIIEDHEIDVVLLDIQMPGETGLQLASRIKEIPQPPAIVFVTAHNQHALEAFNLAAVDYLTKPVRLERLRVAIDRVHFRYLNRPQTPYDQTLDASNAIVINDRQGTRRLPIGEVLYFKADQKYVSVKTNKTTFLIEESLNSLQERWESTFLRIHRNALVPRRLILGLHRSANDSWEIELQAVQERLEVSRRNVAEVRHFIVSSDLKLSDPPN